MNLMKKLRTPVLALMLSAASMGIFNGCATMGPWQEIRREERPTGVERTVTRNIGTKDIDTKTFEISDVYIEDDVYKTKITESLKRETYSLEEKVRVKKFNEIAIEQRKDEGAGVAAGVALGILFGVGGAIGGGVLGKKIDEGINEELGINEEGDSFLPVLLWSILGGAGGLSLGIKLGESVNQTERRERNIGIKEESSREDVTETFLGQNLVYENIPASVKFGIVGKSPTYQIWDGIISWTNTNPNLFTSRERLESKLDELPLVQEIKPETRELLRERLLESISEASETITIETREESSNPNLIIENCTKKLKFDYYQLKDEAIYNIVRQFVDEEINSSIKTLNFVVRDDLTHVLIRGSNFEFETDAPSKSELAEKYFTGRLKNYAENCILDYLNGSGIIKNLPEKVEFKVYSPSNIFLEVTHPEYNFVSGEIAIEKDRDTKRTIYMVDKGSKIRLQNSKESIGRIEEN
jgi:hypothetical protein